MADEPLLPNTTQIPNVLLDVLMPLMRASERAVLMYLCRRTFGFQKWSDTISLDQFEHGLQKQGHPVDFGCGVGRPRIVAALAFFERLGLVEKHARVGRGHIATYTMHLSCEIVRKANLFIQTLENAREEIVRLLNLFRKGSDNVKKPPIKGSESEPTKPSTTTKPRSARAREKSDRQDDGPPSVEQRRAMLAELKPLLEQVIKPRPAPDPQQARLLEVKRQAQIALGKGQLTPGEYTELIQQAEAAAPVEEGGADRTAPEEGGQADGSAH